MLKQFLVERETPTPCPLPAGGGIVAGAMPPAPRVTAATPLRLAQDFNPGHRSRRAFTLLEMMISMAVFCLLSLSLGAAIIMSRKLSEEAVYEGSSLTAATGYLEQIKSMDYPVLTAVAAAPGSTPIPTMINDNTTDYLNAGQNNTKTITVDTDINGNIIKTMKMVINPIITDLSTISPPFTAVEIILTYTWTGPDSNVPHVRALRAVRSYVPTY